MVTRRRLLQAAAALPVPSHVPGFAAASAALTAAPVAGHVTHDSVRLCVQASTSTVTSKLFWPGQGRESDAHEFSCSPFTSRPSKLIRKDRANPRFVAERGGERRNFGTREFAGRDVGDIETRRIVASCSDANGKPLWQRTLASAKVDTGGEPV